jgi:hypothetical protein
MWRSFGPAVLTAAFLAGTFQIGQAQPRPGPGVVADPDTTTTVFHGTPGPAGSAAEISGFGSSTTPGYTSSAGGTTVFHGTPAPMARPWLVPPPPPWVPPASALGGGR